MHANDPVADFVKVLDHKRYFSAAAQGPGRRAIDSRLFASIGGFPSISLVRIQIPEQGGRGERRAGPEF